jgi:cell division protein FtsN
LAHFFKVEQSHTNDSVKNTNRANLNDAEVIATDRQADPSDDVKSNFTIQVAAMKQEVDKSVMSHLESVGPIYVVQENGYYKYQVGAYSSLSNAEVAKKQLIKLGFNGSFVIEKNK